jgi:hypothetical protein
MKLIEGTNHSQFGYLGRVLLDAKADITLEQQGIVLRNIVDFLDGIQSGV